MNPLHSTRSLTSFVFVALLLSFGCQTKIEQSPAFKDQADRLDRTDKDVDAVRRKLSVIDRDLQQVTLDVSEIAKHAAQGSPQSQQVFDQRMNKLEQMLQSTGQTLAALDARMEKLEKSVSKVNLQVASRTENSDPTDASVNTIKLVAAMKDISDAPGKTVSKVSTLRTERTSERDKPKGVYHQVVRGESLEQIAKTHRVSLASLQAANRLPKGSSILPGQRLYVPVQR